MDHGSRPSKSRTKDHNSKIIKYFQRATTFSVPTRPYSPGHDRAFSGPIVPLIPVEARQRRTRSSGRFFDVDQEPTSPEVSCIGQIKHKKAMRRLKAKKEDNGGGGGVHVKPKSSSVLSFIFAKGKSRVNSKTPPPPPVVPVQVPSIGQMKRFASGRDKLGGFDWRVSDYSETCEAYDDHETYRNHHFGEEEEEKAEEQTEYQIGHSGPIGIGLERRKEVNLWKRRTMVAPRPLHLD